MQILAATDFSTRSHRALRRAGLVARCCAADLTLVHVVDDDQPEDLVELERREADRILTGQVAATAELQGTRCRSMVVTGDPFDGILRTASSIQAGLVVMGSHRRQLLRDIFVGTTVERVLRTGPHPVLMVNNDVQQPYRTALAAVDMSEPSAHAIRVARTAGFVAEDGLAVVHAFDSLGRGKLTVAGVNRSSIDAYVAREHQEAAEELAAFLTANGLEARTMSLRVEEGGAFEVIARAVEDLRPDVLVMGTRARSGVSKMLLGSVAEEALRRLDVDILAVPPLRSDG